MQQRSWSFNRSEQFVNNELKTLERLRSKELSQPQLWLSEQTPIDLEPHNVLRPTDVKSSIHSFS